LLAKIYKAKYYPQEDILKARIGSNPSYAWRSIWNSKDIVNKGSCWNIGNGQQIKVREDQWLPNLNGHKILYPDTGINNDVCVKDLMHGQALNWNQRIIDREFLEFERDMIKQLPIFHENVQDKLIWIYYILKMVTILSNQAIRSSSTGRTGRGRVCRIRINKGKCGTEFGS
jgi:hypothetical protein